MAVSSITDDPRDGGSTPTLDRWRILIALSAIYASFGFVIATTASLVTPIRNDLGLSNSQMGLVLGAWQLSYIAMSIPASRAIDRFGARRTMTVAAVVIVVSALGRALATGFPSLLIGAAVLGLGTPLVSVGSPAVTASLFDGRDRRRAVAMYGTAPAAGSMFGFFLPGSLLLPLFDNNWRPVLLVSAAVAAAAIVGWLLASRDLDRVMVPGSGPRLVDYLSIARLPIVRTILVLATLTFFVMHGTGQWIVPLVESSGRSLAQAGRWATFASIMTLMVSLTVPQVTSPRWRGPMIVAAALTGAVAVHGLSAVDPSTLALSLGAVGWARAGLVPLFMLILMDHPDVGSANTAAATGLFFAVAQLGGVAGPALTGLLAEGAGGGPGSLPDFAVALTLHSAVLGAIAVVTIAAMLTGVVRSTKHGSQLALGDD